MFPIPSSSGPLIFYGCRAASRPTFWRTSYFWPNCPDYPTFWPKVLQNVLLFHNFVFFYFKFTVICFLCNQHPLYCLCSLSKEIVYLSNGYYTQLVWNYVQFNSLTEVPIMTITLSLSLLLLFQLGVITL